MNILILGGTRFVGLHIAEALLSAGHTLAVVNRGISPATLPAQVERLAGDRDAGARGLEVLRGRTWDVCIDVSGYTPKQVRASAELLRDKVAHYVFVSAVSVYGDPEQPPVLETHPRLPPADEHVVEVDGATYGPLKVACEDIVGEIYPERCTLLRPQIIVGPGDNWDRYTYWVQRALRDGPMLAPGDGSDVLQVIDVRDVARFVRIVVERGLNGAFNLAGPRLAWAEFMAILGARDLVWVASAILQRAGLTFVELPLYRPRDGARASLMHVSGGRAIAAGLSLTDPAQTARDVRAWCRERPWSPALTAGREAELIGLARAGDVREL